VPEKPYPTLKGVQIILRELGAKDPAARSARPEQFVDTSILKELDSSGFIDKVYKTGALAKAGPRTEPVAAPAPAKVQVAEAKARPALAEEKAKPAAKPVPAATEKIPASAPAAKPSSAAQSYTVRPGDTLARLSEQFYSSPHKWEKIFEANRDVLKNPNYIYVGMKLTIPADDKAS